MTEASVREVRSLILERLHDAILANGLNPDQLADDFDLLTQGVVDSLALVDLLASLEAELGISIDYSELDPENLTLIGPLSQFIAGRVTTVVQKRAYKSSF
jgi:acyl carrier protein